MICAIYECISINQNLNGIILKNIITHTCIQFNQHASVRPHRENYIDLMIR